MHDQIPTSEPTRLRAGDQWNWDRTLSDHSPADGWALTYILRSGSISHSIEATGNVDHFEVRHAAASSEFYSPGIYRLIGRISKENERYTIYDKVVTLEPDPVEGKPSFNERMLARLEAELESRIAGGSVKTWSQGGRSEEVLDDDALRNQIGYYREQVRVERGGQVIVPVRGCFVSS